MRQRRAPTGPRRIRVLSLQSTAILGGTELMNLSILQHINREYFELVICFLDEEGPVSKCYRQEGFEVVHLNYHHRALPVVSWDLFRLLQTRDFDIVHIYGLRANLLGRTIGRVTGCHNIITSQHSIDLWRKRWHVWLDRFTSRWVSLYIPNTYAGAERLEKVERVPVHKLRVIHNGLDVTPFEKATRGNVRAELRVADDIPVIICVAHFRAAKGHETLLDAATLMHREGLSFHLWLVGDGPLRRAMEDKAGALGLQHDVTFLGVQTDIPEILADSDIFVLASNWEGMPGAVMEAMAARLPVVATHVGGVPELVVDGKTGILVPPQTSGALATALAELINDVDLRRRMGEAGHQHILSCFRLQDKVRQLEEVYSRLYRRSLHELQVFEN